MYNLLITASPASQGNAHFDSPRLAFSNAWKVVWPSASRAWELLNGVKMGSDDLLPQITFLDRQKRPADAAFGQEKNSDYLQREVFKNPAFESNAREENTGVQELGTRIMAHMLGLHIPGIEASTSYYPGYEWWPRSQEVTPTTSHPTAVDYGPRSSLGPTTTAPGVRITNGWNPVPVSDAMYNYDYNSYGL
ncbi:hypothetical protein C0995_001559 [Termitomyces sp. Mi166|nr:hypothetical protein C0995_001559 [Termitomyces sp. Mi166\